MVKEALDADELFVTLKIRVFCSDDNWTIWDVERDTLLLGESLELGRQCAVSRLCPGFDGPLLNALVLVWDHPIQVKVNRVAKTLAFRTRSERVVEEKQTQFGLLVGELALPAFKMSR